MLSQKNVCQKSVKKNSKFSKADQHDGRIQIWNKWLNTYEVIATPSSKVSYLELLKLLETPLKVDYKVHEYREIGILSYIWFNKMFFQHKYTVVSYVHH